MKPLKPLVPLAKRKKAPPAPKPSNISTHDYDPKTGALTVTFQGGKRYRYDDVSPAKAADFQRAESKGTFLHHHIIPSHTGTKISD